MPFPAMLPERPVYNSVADGMTGCLLECGFGVGEFNGVPIFCFKPEPIQYCRFLLAG